MSDNRAYYPEILQNILYNNASFSDLKNTICNDDMGFVNMLFLSALRHLFFIRYEVLPQFIKKKIPNKQRILEFILILAITELFFLDTPDYAVVNSYTNIAKKKTDKFGGNFVNAILRNIIRNKENLLKNRKSKFFSPQFLKILKQDYSADEIGGMEEFVTIEAPLDLTLKSDADVSLPEGVMLPTGSLRMPANNRVTSLCGYNDGLWWVQDAASSIPVRCLTNLQNKKVLDLCAAPGGKTAQLLDAGAIVTAVDVSEKRLDKLKENIQRLKLEKNLRIVCSDALKLSFDEKFDIVLIDAPCSATGTFRRHPEIIHTKSFDDVKKQAALQKSILDYAVKFVAPKGLLLYATCSLSKMEGEIQMRHFLANHQEYEIVPITLKGTENMRTKEGFLRILPQHFKEFLGIDGFFVAVLKRKI